MHFLGSGWALKVDSFALSFALHQLRACLALPIGSRAEPPYLTRPETSLLLPSAAPRALSCVHGRRAPPLGERAVAPVAGLHERVKRQVGAA